MSHWCCAYYNRRLLADNLVLTDLDAFLNLLGQAAMDHLPNAAHPQSGAKGEDEAHKRKSKGHARPRRSVEESAAGSLVPA